MHALGLGPDEVGRLVREYGAFSLAASARQPGMRCFGDETGAVVFAEACVGGRTSWIALGEPLAPVTRWVELVHEFVVAARNPVFLNVGDELAELLIEEGMTVNGLGWEGILDLQTYDLRGSRKQNIRNAVNRCARGGYVVEELDTVDDADWREISAVSAEWLAARGRLRPENTLITRPLTRPTDGERLFVMRDCDGAIVQFVTLDDINQAGHVIGYHSNINRGRRSSPKGADYALHAAIIERLRAECLPYFSLGLSPALEKTSSARHRNTYLALALSYGYRSGQGLHNLRGIHEHKAEYRPSHRRPVHVAIQNPWPAVDLQMVLRACHYW